MSKPQTTPPLNFLVGFLLFITLPFWATIWFVIQLIKFIAFFGEAFIHRNDPIVISDECAKAFMLWCGVKNDKNKN